MLLIKIDVRCIPKWPARRARLTTLNYSSPSESSSSDSLYPKTQQSPDSSPSYEDMKHSINSMALRDNPSSDWALYIGTLCLTTGSHNPTWTLHASGKDCSSNPCTHVSARAISLTWMSSNFWCVWEKAPMEKFTWYEAESLAMYLPWRGFSKIHWSTTKRSWLCSLKERIWFTSTAILIQWSCTPPSSPQIILTFCSIIVREVSYSFISSGEAKTRSLSLKSNYIFAKFSCQWSIFTVKKCYIETLKYIHLYLARKCVCGHKWPP